MTLYYEGVDITDDVQIVQCAARDGCGERADGLEIEFENAAGWYNWGPQEDDRIEVEHEGYSSGTLYVNTVMPAEGRFRLLATSLPCGARERAYKSFRDKSIEEIMRGCAAACSMGYQLFGINGAARIPYIQRENEGCAAFLRRLMTLEGAQFKCVNGKFTGIGIAYAQELEAMQTIEIGNGQPGAEYRRNGQKLRALTVETPYARVTAQDADVPDTHARITRGEYPAMNEVQAGRWARGLLLHENRGCESLRLRSEFNAGFTAMARIDIDGDTDANGEWLIEQVEHDFINLTSTALMHRCIGSIS